MSSVHLSPFLDGALPWHRDSTASTDEDRFHALYLATARPLLAYLHGVTGRPDLAEDLLQETFCRFLLRGPSLLAQEEARRYLFRTATNLLRDRWRRQEDRPFLETAAAQSEPSADVPFDRQFDVRRAMQSLKPRERELLWLAYVEGMTHREIAAVTGLRPLSVRLLLFRARSRAASLLEPHKDLP